MIRLQRCETCHIAQYPPREFCGACLSDRLACEVADALPGRVLARTRLHHSNAAHSGVHLPLMLGLVQFNAGPVAVCFLAEGVLPGDSVQVRLRTDDLLEAG